MCIRDRVIAIAIGSGYLNTNLAKYVNWGPMTSLIPFGVISVINVGISMMSTRLTGRLSNIGNVLGIINTALSGTIDYLSLIHISAVSFRPTLNFRIELAFSC